MVDRILVKLKGKSPIAECHLQRSESNGSSHTADSPCSATGNLRHPTRGCRCLDGCLGGLRIGPSGTGPSGAGRCAGRRRSDSWAGGGSGARTTGAGTNGGAIGVVNGGYIVDNSCGAPKRLGSCASKGQCRLSPVRIALEIRSARSTVTNCADSLSLASERAHLAEGAAKESC
jgi:hypothetical protein